MFMWFGLSIVNTKHNTKIKSTYMSKTKSKKKYKPKPIYIPNLITAMYSFEPLEKALHELMTVGEIFEDDRGNYAFIDGSGRIRSFHEDLFLYIQFVLIYGERTGQSFDVSAVNDLRRALDEKTEFSEKQIRLALEDIKKYKNLFTRIKPTESRSILDEITVRFKSIQQVRAENPQLG